MFSKKHIFKNNLCNSGTMGPYAYKGTEWVSFDDVAMIKHKSEYVKKMNLGGAMIWALDLDDFR